MSLNTFARATEVIEAVIAQTETVSGDLYLGGLSISAITTPAALDSIALSFQVSVDGVTWLPLNDADGSAVGLTIAVDEAIALGPLETYLAPWPYARLVAGTIETAERTFGVVLRHV